MKIRIFLFFVLLFMTFSISASADDQPYDCTVRFVKGEYVLAENEEETVRSVSVLPVLELVGDKRVYFDNVRIYENVIFENGIRNFHGNLFLDGDGGIEIIGGIVNFENSSITLLGDSSYLKINSGNFTLKDSTVKSEGKYAIDLTTRDATLTLLGECGIIGREYDVISSGLVYISDGKNDNHNNDVIKIKYTGEGRRLCDIVDCGTSAPSVKIFSENDEEIPIHTISYVNEKHRSYRQYRLDGEPLCSADGVNISGYDFIGWRTSAASVGTIANSSMTLYAEYELSDPTFYIDDLRLVYDGDEHEISPSSLYHPLLSDGAVSFRWYRDGELVSEEEFLSVKNVADSGKYELEILFEYAGELAVSEPCEINVFIDPKPLKLEYVDGEFRAATDSENNADLPDIYTYQKDGRIYAKTDNLNYCLEFSPQISKMHSVKIGVVLCMIAVIVLLIFGGFFVFWSAEEDACIANVANRVTALRSEDNFVRDRFENDDNIESRFAYYSATADGLLTDRLARDMITKGMAITTAGNKKCEISIGDINDAFDSDSSVDINILKERGLISADAYKIKVTSEGKIDKPLKIFANEFDITAAKMIILSGGSAVKVKSRRKIS